MDLHILVIFMLLFVLWWVLNEWKKKNICRYCGQRPHHEHCPYKGTSIFE